jgi:hypothetical protein
VEKISLAAGLAQLGYGSWEKVQRSLHLSVTNTSMRMYSGEQAKDIIIKQDQRPGDRCVG